jgi:glycosyltransferase involved in cell wall biosynthesis
VSTDTILALLFAVRLRRSLNRYSVHEEVFAVRVAAEELPTVSVCIPARNEKHAMTQCLERVLASDYEKLEIIVFDDSSDDETSILIRSFAHAGVRFVPGTELPEGWLGKNHALDILAKEASATYLLFMDVDTYIHPTTVSRLVAYMVNAKKDMVSVIPGRDDSWRSSVFFGPLRYFWQLVFATPKNPAASAAFWAIDRDVLASVGGLTQYKQEVRAEARIAKQVGESYQCLVENGELGVTYEKKWRSQVETSRRLLYPMVRGWKVWLAFVSLVVLNIPSILLLSGFITGWTNLHIASLTILVMYMAVYAGYTHVIWHRNWWLGGLLWPAVILQELVLFILSATGYARHTITWKGRSVTSPVVQVDHIEIDD